MLLNDYYFTECESGKVSTQCGDIWEVDELCEQTCSDVRGETECVLKDIDCKSGDNVSIRRAKKLIVKSERKSKY